MQRLRTRSKRPVRARGRLHICLWCIEYCWKHLAKLSNASARATRALIGQLTPSRQILVCQLSTVTSHGYRKPPAAAASAPRAPLSTPRKNFALRSQTRPPRGPEDPHRVQKRENHITKRTHAARTTTSGWRRRARPRYRAPPRRFFRLVRLVAAARPVAIQLRLDEDQGCGAWTRNPSGSTANS